MQILDRYCGFDYDLTKYQARTLDHLIYRQAATEYAKKNVPAWSILTRLVWKSPQYRESRFSLKLSRTRLFYMKRQKRDRHERAFTRGYQIGLHGRSRDLCPYQDEEKRQSWLSGWRSGREDNWDGLTGTAGISQHYPG